MLAQDGRATIRPGDVPWPTAGTGTSGAGGIQTVVLKGDPAKAGLYTLMLRVAPNVRIQAHTHRDDQVATVLKGTWYFGYGDRFDEAALRVAGTGQLLHRAAQRDALRHDERGSHHPDRRHGSVLDHIRRSCERPGEKMIQPLSERGGALRTSRAPRYSRRAPCSDSRALRTER